MEWTGPGQAMKIATMTEESKATLARQPVGYWTGVAHREVVGFVQAAIGRQGLSQPQWWTLNTISGPGLTRAQLSVALRERFRSVSLDDADLEPLLAGLMSLGFVVTEGDQLRLSPAGNERRDLVLAALGQARQQTHEGISDTEYAAALQVLRRMVRNVGGVDRLL